MPANLISPTSVVERLFKVDPPAAKLLLYGLAPFATLAIVLQWRIDIEQAWKPLVIIAAAGFFFSILSKISNKLGNILAWFLSIMFMAYVSCFAVQLITHNRLPIMPAGCFLKINQPGCPMQVIQIATPASGTQVDTETVGLPEEVETTTLSLEEGIPADKIAPQGTRSIVLSSRPGSGGELFRLPNPTPVVTQDPAAPAGANSVHIHFHGQSVPEARVAGLSTGLRDLGWSVAGKGKAVSSAFGYNELRFFHAGDAKNAAHLLHAMAKPLDWNRPLRLVDMSLEGYKVPRGYMELWISQN